MFSLGYAFSPVYLSLIYLHAVLLAGLAAFFSFFISGIRSKHGFANSTAFYLERRRRPATTVSDHEIE